MRKFLISLGHPLYILLRFLFSLSPKRPRRKEVVIYKAPTPYLKNFLKFIYPLTQLRFPKFKFQISNFKLVALVLLVFIGIYWYVFRGLPAPSALTTQPVPLTTHIRDRHGVELYKIYASQNRTLVKLPDIPLQLRQATIAIEDAEFYRHSGFSLRGIFRALISNSSLLTTHNTSTIQGGSTITQQLVKTALLSPERTLRRKIRELVLAILVELKYPKDQILEMYLNRVSFGGAAYGVEEAAQTYFGKPVSQLTLAESTLLAGLPASPTTYSPYGAHPELAKSRQKEVLRRMVSEGFITFNQANAASAEELKFSPQTIDIKAPHFVMYVREYLAQKYGASIVEQGGLEVITSLDLSVQQSAQTAVTQEVTKVAYLRIGNGAAVVTNPQTGEILAMVGSKDYFDMTHDGNFNVTTALRQPGSSIKPLNYALALTRGFTPASVIDDSPITYKTPGQPNYSPVNYDGKFHGKVTLRTALGSSYNIPAVKVLAANGVSNFIDFAHRLGISSWTDPSRYGLSLTLGGGEVTMLDMARAYGTIANLGVKKELRSVLAITDSNDIDITEEFYRDRNLAFVGSAQASGGMDEVPEGTQVISPLSAYWLIDILSDNKARMPAFGSYARLSVPNHKIAVKTGTSNSFRDNWTIGFSPEYLVAAWVGNNDGSFMNKNLVSGITGAAPIWHDTMSYLLEGREPKEFPKPLGLVPVKVCTVNGLLTCPNCPQEKIEYFTVDKVPTKQCFFRPQAECEEAKKQAEGKSEEERKTLLSACPIVN